jgi:putative GTP pyrophosphokinase
MGILSIRENSDHILAEYDQECQSYTEFTVTIEKLIRQLLQEYGIRVHSVSSRVKSRDSLKKKIEKANNDYRTFDEITDIAGLRIITYFEADVNIVAQMVENEFNINTDLSVNKQDLLDPDRFGYLSVHYIAKLPSSRTALTEYKRYVKCQCEIQIRSILQHAWAEIEHDLGYKSTLAVPREIRRRFSRLAGLLEIADDEFCNIRLDLTKYEQDVPKQIAAAPQNVLVDKASLLSFLKNSDEVRHIDTEIAATIDCEVLRRFDSDYEKYIKMLEFNEIRTIANIKSLLQTEGYRIVGFANLWLQEYDIKRHRPKGVFTAGISLFYLCLYFVGKSGSPEKVRSFFETVGMFGKDSENSIEEGIKNLLFFSKEVQK